MTTHNGSFGLISATAVLTLVVAGLFIARAVGVPPDFERPKPVFLDREVTEADRLEASSPVERTPDLNISGTFSGTGGDNCNEATPTPVSVPDSVTVFGNNSAATGPDTCITNSFNIWWEAFQLSQCANVTLDFCGTDPVLTPSFIVVAGSCSAEGVCGDFFVAELFDRDTCVEGNITMTFEGLAPGVYYYPIISSITGDYQMTVTTTTSECVGAFGACCDIVSESCTDDVAEADCSGADLVFSNGQSCCEVECRDPAGPEFDASNVDLLSRVSIEDFAVFTGIPGNPHTANEMWGYVSPGGREYAIIGFTTGTGFVEVTDPLNLAIVAFIDGGVDTIWRDMAVFSEHAYIVSDGVGVGLQIVDLIDIDNGNVTLAATTNLGAGFSTAHNVYVNPGSGFLYLCASDLNGALGLVAVDLANPLSPVIAGFWTDTAPNVRCHDVQVVTYSTGPFAGREIAFCFAENDGLKIADVTDKSNMFTLSTLVYPNTTYTHQGWLSEDRRYLFIDDELDELNNPNVTVTTTYIADVQDLNNPLFLTSFTNGLCAIDHNLIVQGTRVFEANYTTGLRVFDATNINNVQEIAHFDTHPEDNATDFKGAWGVFTLPSGTVLISDRQRGLFVLEVVEEELPIPTVSTWGLVVMSLLLLTGGTLVLMRRNRSRVLQYARIRAG